MSNGTVIIGGGVIGLSIGWLLAKRGEDVTILERNLAGREASWAAAGMLATASEVRYQDDLNLLLGRESMRLYPQFVETLEAEAGYSVDYRKEGTLAVALRADDASELRAHYNYQRGKKLPVEWLSGDAVRELEPSPSNFVAAGVRIPMDHQIDNRRLVSALADAFRKSGGTLLENTDVDGLRIEGGAFKAVIAGAHEWPARQMVVAAGSWSGLIPGLPDAAKLPVRPVKGQMLSMRAPSPEFLRHVIRSPNIYIAPKGDGRIVFGATVEEQGFDRDLTAGGIYSLLKGAWEAVPGVYDLAIEEMWTGFRPGSRDNAPLLGQTCVAGIYAATGHHRGGILMTPATATHMSSYLTDGRCPDILKPFDPKRFSG